MNTKCRLYVLSGMIASLVVTIKADITDIFRPENERENYAEGTQSSGFLHETYTDKDGNTHRRFAPVESIFRKSDREQYQQNSKSQKSKRKGASKKQTRKDKTDESAPESSN